MISQTIPITLSKEDVLKLDKIAEAELSSRNRLLRIAIKRYLENQDENPKTKK